MSDAWRIENEEQIEELLGSPSQMVQQKIFDHVDEYAAAFIAKSPLLLVATSDRDGRLDVSPKGDAPGFVSIEDSKTLLLPERIGNRLAFGFRNILSNPRIALIFVVPGTTETLRLSGTAELTRDPALLERLSAKGKPALLVTRVAVEECFFHCGKAFIRSALWQPGTWPEGYRVNFGRQLAKRMGGGDDVVEKVEEALVDSYTNRLY
ncbi:MAG TPA: MSMEG_1061 family FMN-dependent PPOX-type flavoprotein [Candidatus Limnocylindrales bacterium]|nr:MSMEG_1061 family FMN-dependent PPOX-type flavoprotein [Candidatus Limnocylindrales bacterium]